MKTKTDLSSIKELAKTFLMIDIKTTPYSPVIVMHPFTNTGFVYFKGGSKPENILENDNALLRWQKAMKNQIDQSDSIDRIFLLLTKPYRLVFLKYSEAYLTQKDFSQMLAEIWIQTEAPHNDLNFSTNKLIGLFKKADPVYLMETDEYEQFKEFDDTVTVYRGVTPHNADNLKGLSWTLNPETAKWFANRFGEDGKVYEAQIDRSHIYAYFSSRNESEIIVDPKYLTDIAEYEDLTNEFTQTI